MGTKDGDLWKVIGGAKTGGIMVRFGMDKDSPQVKERLGTGAIVKQLKLAGERLRFEKQEGDGPDTGWVSIKLKDNLLLEPLVKKAEVKAACPACKDGPLEFPKEFIFGVATAAYQIEGAAFEGGRKPSIWDAFSHTEGKTRDGATGDVACDHYHRWKSDIEVIKALKVDAYRFSISWSRVLPVGGDQVNQEGIDFYSNIIDELLKNNITPWVTLYHWDMPYALLEAYGGWAGPKEQVVPDFVHFATTCFKAFGDRVNNWMTLNEPGCTCNLGHGVTGKFAPGYQEGLASSRRGGQEYHVGHNLLCAHAEAVKVYRDHFKRPGGQIGIAFNAAYKRANDMGKSEDVAAATRAMEFELGWFCAPIYKGDYPAVMKEIVKDRLPKFTKEEKEKLKGSLDFFGINNYFSSLAMNLTTAKQQGFRGFEPGFDDDLAAYTIDDPGWDRTDQGWAVCPWGFRDLLIHIWDTYKPPGGIVITECGCAMETDQSKAHDQQEGALIPEPWSETTAEPEDFENETYPDPKRKRFIEASLAATHSAMDRGCDIKAFFAWSMMDNFEWENGYNDRFGIVRVDYETQKRTIKESGRFLAQVSSTHSFEMPLKEEFEWGGRKWDRL